MVSLVSCLRVSCLVAGVSACLFLSPALAQDSTDLANVLDPGEAQSTPLGNFSSYAVEGASDEAALITGTDSDEGSFQMSVVPAGDESWWAPAAGGVALFGTAALRALPRVVEATPKSPSPAALVVTAVAVVGVLSQEPEPELDPGTEEEREVRRLEFAMEAAQSEGGAEGAGDPPPRPGGPDIWRQNPDRGPYRSRPIPGEPDPLLPFVTPDDPDDPMPWMPREPGIPSDLNTGLWLVSYGYQFGDGEVGGDVGDTLTPQAGDDPRRLVFYASDEGGGEGDGEGEGEVTPAREDESVVSTTPDPDAPAPSASGEDQRWVDAVLSRARRNKEGDDWVGVAAGVRELEDATPERIRALTDRLDADDHGGLSQAVAVQLATALKIPVEWPVVELGALDAMPQATTAAVPARGETIVRADDSADDPDPGKVALRQLAQEETRGTLDSYVSVMEVDDIIAALNTGGPSSIRDKLLAEYLRRNGVPYGF